MGWVVNGTLRPLYPRERHPVPIVQEAWWALGPVWTGAEKSHPSPGLDSRTAQHVASLSYPGPLLSFRHHMFCNLTECESKK